MHKVAHHLQVEAVKAPEDEKDLYARSAYNRYYYDIFLATRDMLNSFDPKWSSGGHKDYPDILNKIADDYKKEQKRAKRNGDNELVKVMDAGIFSAKALASLMVKAYGVRVAADYYPSELVNFSTGSRFSLKSIEITEAHSWREKVRIWILNINQAWKQIYVR